MTRDAGHGTTTRDAGHGTTTRDTGRGTTTRDTAGGQLDQPAPLALFASHPSRGLSPASRPKSETGGPCVARPKHHCSYWPFAPLKKLPLFRPNDTADRPIAGNRPVSVPAFFSQATNLESPASSVAADGGSVQRRVPVPQNVSAVKGKGFAAVLTRSLRFATGCGLRAAP